MRPLLAFPTAGTRETLAECISSLVENALDNGHEPAVLIATNAENEGAVSFVRAVGEAAREGLDVPVQVIDGEHTGRLVQKLAARLEESHDRDGGRATGSHDRGGPGELEDVLRFGLLPLAHTELGGSPGPSYNMILLQSAGRSCIMTDDDVVSDPAVQQGTGRDAEDDGLRVHSLPELTDEQLPFSLRYHMDRDGALGDVTKVVLDIVGAHLNALGELSSQNGETAPAGNSRPEETAARRVLLSSVGTYGDSGMGSARTALVLGGSDRDLMCADEESYALRRLSREVVRSTQRPRVGASTNFMAMQSAVDNQVVLPPHFPLGRNSDGLFAVMTRVAYPGSLTWFQDFCLLHAPPEPRVFTLDELHIWRPAPADLVMHLVVALAGQIEADEPADRLETLGALLVQIANEPNSVFAGALHQVWLNTAVRYTQMLEGLLEHYGRMPAAWAADVDTLIDCVHGMMQETGSLFGPAGCGLSPEKMRESVGSYGRLLGIWPEVWSVMAEQA